MLFVQELSEILAEKEIYWPERAMIAMRDGDGEIKFSSKGKYDVPFDEDVEIYMRGEDCLFNLNFEKGLPFMRGTTGVPDLITKSQFEEWEYAKG